jgi:hypothetical protein
MARKTKPKKITEYELPRLNIKAEKLVLAADPGSRNFGIALVGLERDKVKVYANSVLMRPVDNLVAFTDTSTLFLKEIQQWMAFGPDGVVAERFQTRGNGGPLIEMVSSMLGLIRGRYPKTPIKLTIASAWKNRVQRRFGVDLREVYTEIAVQPHQLDAALIGVFGLEEGLATVLDYDLDDVIAQVEATSLIGTK